VIDLGRKHLMILVGFVATTLVAHVAMSRLGYTLLDPEASEVRAERLFAYVTRERTEDVLIIGSSRVGGGLDSRIVASELSAELDVDVGVYKLGLPGLRPLFLAELLETAVARRPPNDVLVLAIETRNFVIPIGAERAARLDDEADPTDDTIRGEWEADRVESRLAEPFDGLDALWNLGWTLRARTREAAAFQHANGGEVHTAEERRAIEEIVAQQRIGRGDPFERSKGSGWLWSPPDTPDQVGWRRVLDACERLPCRVIFIRMPLKRGFDEEHMPVVSKRFADEVVGELTARGFEYHDLNAEPYPRRRRYFVGLTHLNADGCAETSRLLATELLSPALRAARR